MILRSSSCQLEQPMTSRPRTLDGILVVPVEQAVAAPFATRQLADLDARVIKVERSRVVISPAAWAAATARSWSAVES